MTAWSTSQFICPERASSSSCVCVSSRCSGVISASTSATSTPAARPKRYEATAILHSAIAVSFTTRCRACVSETYWFSHILLSPSSWRRDARASSTSAAFILSFSFRLFVHSFNTRLHSIIYDFLNSSTEDTAGASCSISP